MCKFAGYYLKPKRILTDVVLLSKSVDWNRIATLNAFNAPDPPVTNVVDNIVPPDKTVATLLKVVNAEVQPNVVSQ
jgi:hypothetical protein